MIIHHVGLHRVIHIKRLAQFKSEMPSVVGRDQTAPVVDHVIADIDDSGTAKLRVSRAVVGEEIVVQTTVQDKKSK